MMPTTGLHESPALLFGELTDGPPPDGAIRQIDRSIKGPPAD